MSDPTAKERSPLLDDLSRRHRVRILLLSWLDWMPSPKSARLASEPGPAPSKTACPRCSKGRVIGEGSAAKPCEQCKAGRARPHGCRPCVACDATGWRNPRRGDTTVDPVLNVADVETFESSHQRSDLRRRYRQLEQGDLALQDASVLMEVERVVDYGIREQRRLWSEGSYAELGRCLAWLSDAHPNRSRLVWRALIFQEPLRLAARSAAALDETLDWLAERMPSDIRLPAHLEPETPDERAAREKLEMWRGHRREAEKQRLLERDQAVAHQAFALGMDVPEIAAQQALSERRVRQIIGAMLPTAGTAA